MLRVGSSAIAKRAILSSNKRCGASSVQPFMNFHSSLRRDEDAVAKTEATSPSKGGLFGTGINELFMLPVGIALAVPIIKFEWYVVNEETQLLAVFVAFCVTFYKQGGEAVFKSLDANAEAIIKEHNEAEDKVIEALEKKLDYLNNNTKTVDVLESVNAVRSECYDKLNAAGKVKPHHDLKMQVERVLELIAAEENSMAEKKKIALMEEATEAVKVMFESKPKLKKSALDAAIASIKGDSGVVDPVKSEFISFFQAKAAEAKAASDGSEEAESRAVLTSKINAVAKNENYFFEFDDKGALKLNV